MRSEPDGDGQSKGSENIEDATGSQLKSALALFFRGDPDVETKEKLKEFVNELRERGTVCGGDGDRETEAGAVTSDHAEDVSLEAGDLDDVLVVLQEMEDDDQIRI